MQFVIICLAGVTASMQAQYAYGVYIYIHSHSKSRSRLFAGLFICLLATAIKRNYRAQRTKQSAGKVHLLLPLCIYIYTIYTHDSNQDPKSPEPQKARECRREFWKSCKSCRQHRSISHFRICVAIINLFCTLATDFVY